MKRLSFGRRYNHFLLTLFFTSSNTAPPALWGQIEINMAIVASKSKCRWLLTA